MSYCDSAAMFSLYAWLTTPGAQQRAAVDGVIRGHWVLDVSAFSSLGPGDHYSTTLLPVAQYVHLLPALSSPQCLSCPRCLSRVD